MMHKNNCRIRSNSLREEPEKRNFTLIELLMVAAIIAILAGILLPALNTVRETARKISCAARMKDTSMSIQLYATDNHDTLVSSKFTGESYATNHLVMVLNYMKTSPSTLGKDVTDIRMDQKKRPVSHSIQSAILCPSYVWATTLQNKPTFPFWNGYAGTFAYSYMGNDEVFYRQGIKITQIRRPSSILAYSEGTESCFYYYRISFFNAHGKGANVSWFDGHVSFFPNPYPRNAKCSDYPFPFAHSESQKFCGWSKYLFE